MTELAKSQTVVRFIQELQDAYGSAHWDHLILRARAKGIEKTELEDLLNDLLDEGLVYEPILGRLKVL